MDPCQGAVLVRLGVSWPSRFDLLDAFLRRAGPRVEKTLARSMLSFLRAEAFYQKACSYRLTWVQDLCYIAAVLQGREASRRIVRFPRRFALPVRRTSEVAA